MSRTFKTGKGTELPLLNLRGRDYLEVKYRLVWFREEHPSWSIETDFISFADKAACAKAVIRDDQGKIISTSHKLETERSFPDFMEKAETGAIGRALALIGYGTQFCADELDEGKRIVDSPVEPLTQREVPSLDENAAIAADLGGTADTPPSAQQLGEFEIQFGRKYRGRKLKEIPRKEIEGYVAWLEAEAEKRGTPLSHNVKVLKYAVQNYFGAKPTPSPGEPESVEEAA